MKILPIEFMTRKGLVEVYNRYRDPQIRSFSNKSKAIESVNEAIQEAFAGIPDGFMPLHLAPKGFEPIAEEVCEWGGAEAPVVEASTETEPDTPGNDQNDPEPVEEPDVIESPAAPEEPVTVVPATPDVGYRIPKPPVASMTGSIGVAAAWILYNNERKENATR